MLSSSSHRVTSSLNASVFFVLTLAVLLLLAVAGSLAFGSRAIPLPEVLAALLSGADTDNATVITSQRLPRTLLGLGCGVALGMAGALMQGHTRNPLADPGLFGVNAGAAFGVALLIFGAGVTDRAPIVLAALVGAGAVSSFVFLIGLRDSRGGALVTLAIVGAATGALLSALTTAMVLLDRQTLEVMRFWEVGALSNRDYSLMTWVAPLLVIGVGLALLNAFSLDLLGLGDELAQSLGTRVRTARIIGVVAITLLVGPATAICGPIAFLGLVAPHAARAVVRHDHRWLVPCAGLIGAVILLVADTVGRVIGGRGELQVGIVMALVGAPVILSITRRRRLVAL